MVARGARLVGYDTMTVVFEGGAEVEGKGAVGEGGLGY